LNLFNYKNHFYKNDLLKNNYYNKKCLALKH
jgi:hypothetical protein